MFVATRPRNESPEEAANATSAVTLRLIIGVLGFILPILCYGYALFSRTLLPTISHYYYTPIHGEFIAILCGFGFVLVVYRGYDNWDRIATFIAAIFAFGVALFPADPGRLTLPDLSKLFLDSAKVNGKIHDYSAAGLFLTFFFISAFLFTRRPSEPSTRPSWSEFRKELKRTYAFLPSPKPTPDDPHEKENRFHRLCAWIILISIIASAYIIFIRRPENLPLWFSALETAAIWAFAASWIAKNRWKNSR